MVVSTVYWIGSLQEIGPYLPRIYDQRIPLLFKRAFRDAPRELYALDAHLSKNSFKVHPSKEKDPENLNPSQEVIIREGQINPEGDEVFKAFLGIDFMQYLQLSEPLPWTKSKPHEVPPEIADHLPVFWFSSFEELSRVYGALKRVVLAPSPQGPWEIYKTYGGLNPGQDVLYVETNPYYYSASGERRVGQGSAGRIARSEMDAEELFVGLCTQEEVPPKLRRRSKSNPEKAKENPLGRNRSQTVHLVDV